jgi:hypothetical protein
MVFQLPAEFGFPEIEVAHFVLGAERAIFEKPEELGKHMKPQYIKGHLDGMLVDHMLLDRGGRASTSCHASSLRSLVTMSRS